MKYLNALVLVITFITIHSGKTIYEINCNSIILLYQVDVGYTTIGLSSGKELYDIDNPVSEILARCRK